jgi:maltose O-acetyltransferase
MTGSQNGGVRMTLRSAVGKAYDYVVHHNQLEEYISNGLVVGEHFYMYAEVMIDHAHAWHVEIGDEVTLAPRVQILAHDASTFPYLGYTRIAKVKIGSRVFVGAGSIILPGVTIGDDVVIGAGSVVSHDIPSGHVAAGNPARVISTIDEYLTKRRAEMDSVPCFGQEYRIEENVTPEMKAEMGRQMTDGVGYVV